MNLSRARTALLGVSLSLLAVVALLALLVVPADRYQGDAQRLLYVHVGTAWTAYVCFALVAVGSIAYLVRRRMLWDRIAGAAASVGVGMAGLTLVLGSLWAKPTWGTFWTWDPRLVSTAALLLIYLGYLGVRDLSEDATVNARRSAVFGVLALVIVPVVHFSTVWWRTLHQPPGVLRPGGPQETMPTEMVLLLLLATFSLTLLAVALVWERVARQTAVLDVERGPVESVTRVSVGTPGARDDEGGTQ
ncbi:cytochrome c biogenesis protein CcsA [Janibacter cremeus]|uniref:cytochrome c biogenesis protein CcsA n=1 Tax=Janibacter cremeus TaxID=1285192 RepID=UPI0023F71CE2|nr:cytochrome c biogenesis protein CcsA [Janibacter cremeus]WEV78801.1 cytochrome c biogenesis protein CcsA [Janibacter cremeus]